MKRGLKRILALGLAVVMTLPLAACGDGENAGSTAVVQKEFVYVPEYQELKDVNYINTTCSDGKGFYFVTDSFDEETGVSKTLIKYLDATTKELKEIPFALTLGEDGSSGYIQHMALVDNGASLALLENRYEVINEETWEGINHMNLKFVAVADGAVTAETDITEEFNKTPENAYIQYMAADKDGNVYLCNGNNMIWVFDKTGKKLFDMNLGADAGIQGMGTTKDGQVVYMTYGQAGGQMELNVIDPATRGVSKTCKNNVPQSWGNGTIVPGIEKGVLINGSSGLVEYDLDTEKATTVLEWLDSDMNRDDVRFYMALEDGRILAMTNEYTEDANKCEAVYLTKTPSSELPQKEILTLGAMYLSQEMNSAVIRFNKNSDKYRIQVIDYGNMGDGNDWEASITRFNNDMTSGNGPDIFDLNSLNLQMLAQKGIIEDLNPYIEKDAEIKKEDYFESVINAYTINGKLYSIPNCFYVQTVIGRTSDVGSEPGWTLDELMALLETKPEGTEILDYATKESVMQMCLMFGFDSYINWETGECKLDSEEFVKVLEFANTFPKEYNYDEDAPSTPSKIQDGTLLTMSTSFSSVQDYQMYSAMFGESITAIGYPTPEGSGTAVSGQNTLAMNAKSEKKEAAWEFLRSFIMPEFYESGNVWGFPTLISAYDKVNEKYMTPEYYEDENGEQVEQSKGGWGWDDFQIDIYASTQEEVDFMTDVINSADRSYSYDTQLFEILNEEAAPFFEGQKSAQEVADIIQSRVQMYVNENR